MKKNYLLGLLLVVWGSLLLTAQTITTISGDMPSTIYACGDGAIFKVNINGPIASGTVINAKLPTGITFNSVVSGNITAVGNANGVNFTLNNALGTASDRTTIEYKVNISCNTAQTGNNVVYTSGSLTHTVPIGNIIKPVLEVGIPTGSSQNATVDVFGTTSYNFKVDHSSAAPVNNVKIFITHSTNVSITSTIGTITYGTPSGSTQVDTLDLTGLQLAAFGDGDNIFEQGEQILGKINAKLLTCSNGETISLKAAYGCGSTVSCESGNPTNYGLTRNVVGDPALTMTQTKKPWPGFLPTEYDTAEYVLKNNGTGTAYNVKVQFGFHTNSNNPQHRDHLDFFDFTVNGNAMNETVDDRADFTFSSNPNGPTDGLADVDGSGGFNDLPPGAQVTIRVKLSQNFTNMNEVCRTKYFNEAGTSGVDAIRWRLISTNACGNDKSFNETNDDKGTNSPFTIGIIGQSSDITSPNNTVNFDADTNNNFTAVYKFGNNNTSISTGLTINASNAFYRLKVVLPPGVVPNSSSPATYSEANKYTISPASSDPANNTYYYNLKPIGTADQNLAISGNVNIPLQVTTPCSNGVFNIKFSVALYRDDTNVYIPEMGCSTSPNFSLSCGTAPAFSIDEFDMKRQTFGYKNSDPTVLATESDITGNGTNHYLNGDKMVAKYKLSINENNLTSAKVNLEYDEYDWLQVGVGNGGIKNITGVYTSSNSSVPFSISGSALENYYTYSNSYTGTDGKLKSGYVFDLMKLFQTGGPLASLTPSSGGKIEFNVNFIVNQDLQVTNASKSTDTATGYLVTGINTYSTFSNNNGSNTVGNYKSDKATTFAYAVNYTLNGTGPVVLSNCTEGTYENVFNFSRNTKFGDLFPDEIRHNARIDKFTILVPKGVTIKPGGSYFKIYGGNNVSIADPVVTYGFNENGTANPEGLYDKYSFTNNGSWPMMDASKNFDIVYLLFKYTTNNLYRNYNTQVPNSFRVIYLEALGQYSLNFEQPRNLGVGNPLPTASNTTITYNLQNYTVTSAGPNPTTATNTAIWPLTITNQSTAALPNFWISVESANNTVVPTLWSGTTEYPMVSYAPGKYWAQVGTINSGAKTFEIRSNNFTICGTGNFVVKTSYECTGYPTNPDTGFANQGNRKLWTQDINMGLTTQNPNLSATSAVNGSGIQTFDICTPIDETLKITNGANGYAYKITPNITLPTGMTFISGSFKVHYNGTDYTITDPTLVTGQTYSVNPYSNSAVPFAITGLPGTSNSTDPRTFDIKYQVAMVCYANNVGNYISGSKIGYNIQYESGCQATMPEINLDSSPIEFGGGVQGKMYANTLTIIEPSGTNGAHHMSDAKELQVTVINQGNAVNSLETIKVFVNPAYDYQESSYQLQAGNTFAAMPLVNEPISQIDASGMRQIVWTLPNGFSSTAGQNTINFNFKLKVVDSQALLCNSSAEITMNTFIGRTLTCAINNQQCSLEYPTGTNQKQTIYGFKPSIVAQTTTTSFTTNAGVTDYQISYSIQNTDQNYEVKEGLKLELYNDSNNNGVLDSGETLLDTKYTTVSIPANQTISGIMAGQFNGSMQNFIMIVKSNSNNQTPYATSNIVSYICNDVPLVVKAACYKPGITTGTSLPTLHGITALGRANDAQSAWPKVRKGAWTVLESNTKGFVMNRLSNSQIAQIPPANLVEGMMVYNTTENCLMINTDGTATGWKCFVTPTCPD